MIIGDNGILTQTERAKELTEQAEEDVQKEMSDLTNEMKSLTSEIPSMKILVNSEDDGIVYAPVVEFQGTIDWGDGTIEVIENTKSNITHTYSANKEYIIKISGSANELYGYTYYDENYYYYINKNIIEILDWGELGASEICFSECVKLREIASPRENSFKNVTDFSYAFEFCKSLTSIPSDLFANCPNATDFSHAFEYCTSLTSIPSDLFVNCSNATSFNSTFHYCTKLTSIPSDLFANCPNVDSFNETFYYCPSLTGNSIRLWEDNNREKYGITENTGGWKCYGGCTKLNDYNTIPDYWKYEETAS